VVVIRLKFSEALEFGFNPGNGPHSEQTNHYFCVSQNGVIMETFIVHTENKTQANAIKAVLKALNVTFEKTNEKPYNPQFVKKIKKSDEEYKAGRFKTVKTEDLWRL
jgi:hypothetical protein